MTLKTDAKNLRQYESSFSLIVEQILAFASSNNLVKEVKDLSFCKKSCSNSLYTVTTTYLSL